MHRLVDQRVPAICWSLAAARVRALSPSGKAPTTRVLLGISRCTRPRLPADQRYQNAYLFGAFCPRQGKGAALMLPSANTSAMQMHLDEISRNVAARAHAVVLMDRAGWHNTDTLKLPRNLTIILLPSR